MSLFNFFDEIYPEKDGALQISNMRFLLSVPEGKGKLLTRRAAGILTSVAILAVTAVVVLASVLGGERAYLMHENMKPLMESIGCTQEEVLTRLSGNELGLVQITADTYAIPGGFELSNAEFEVLLHFEENEGLMDGYSYTTRAKLAPEKAASVLKEFLTEFYSATVVLENGQEIPLAGKSIKQLLNGKEQVVLRDSADVTPASNSGTATAKYIVYLQNADYWEGRLGEYLIQTANFYRDIEVSYIPEAETLEIALSYRVEADREK